MLYNKDLIYHRNIVMIYFVGKAKGAKRSESPLPHKDILEWRHSSVRLLQKQSMA